MPSPDIVFTPTDFVASLNQTLEYAYSSVIVEGEIANFKVSKNRWVYFDIKDEQASIRCFGTIYQLPGPLEDGLRVRLRATPKMHLQFGFSLNLQAIVPVGEGSLKKAADLLYKKLHAEGLFEPDKKRSLPEVPARVGLITSAESAAYADFIKILADKWGGLRIDLADVQVQGEAAAGQIVAAIEYFNQHQAGQEVLVIIRGGGSADDLAVFSDERVVRAIAASRIPTLVAIGHETDESLAELAADRRASTPSNAAQILVPDRQNTIVQLKQSRLYLADNMQNFLIEQVKLTRDDRQRLTQAINQFLKDQRAELRHWQRVITALSPSAALARGYALVRDAQGKLVVSTKTLAPDQALSVQFSDGTIQAVIKEVKSEP